LEEGIDMKKVLTAGIGLAVIACASTYALHLLNRPSDAAVAGGYLILLVIFAGAVEAIRRYRGGR